MILISAKDRFTILKQKYLYSFNKELTDQVCFPTDINKEYFKNVIHLCKTRLMYLT